MIRLYKLSKQYPSGHRALEQVSFHIRPGEFVIVTGPSGSGKSALLKVLFGNEQASSGRAVVNGRNLERMDRRTLAGLRRELGLVFEDSKLIDRLDATDNVALAAEVAGYAPTSARDRAGEALARVGLPASLAARPGQLSAGERQKVALARALVNDPVLVLADEPTGGLDPDASLEIFELLREVNREGTTVLMATHDPDALSLLHCRTLLMYQGRLAEEEALRRASL